MSDSDKIDNTGEDIGDIISLLRRKISFGSKFFTKDIEISRKDFFILFLILNSLIFLLIGQIGLDLIIISTSGIGNDQFAWASIFNGLLIGLIGMALLNGKLKNKCDLLGEKINLIQTPNHAYLPNHPVAQAVPTHKTPPPPQYPPTQSEYQR